MAVHLIESNEDFEIYGPLVMNAEVIAYQGELEKMKTIGLGKGRQDLQSVGKSTYPYIRDMLEISPYSLGYAVEQEDIDGAILDITKASLVPNVHYAPLADFDYISYVLVINKRVIGSDAFNDFILSYNKLADEFNNSNTLRQLVGGSNELWEATNIKFLFLDEGGI